MLWVSVCVRDSVLGFSGYCIGFTQAIREVSLADGVSFIEGLGVHCISDTHLTERDDGGCQSGGIFRGSCP